MEGNSRARALGGILMKLLLVGKLKENGATNGQILGQMLNHYNVQVEYKELLTPKNYRKYDARALGIRPSAIPSTTEREVTTT